MNTDYATKYLRFIKIDFITPSHLLFCQKPKTQEINEASRTQPVISTQNSIKTPLIQRNNKMGRNIAMIEDEKNPFKQWFLMNNTLCYRNKENREGR